MTRLGNTASLLFTAICLLTTSGCINSTYKGYNFELTKPVQSKSLSFSDSKIEITFSPSVTSYYGVEGTSNYENYEGLSFSLKNKTNAVITLDWNKITFEDYSGTSGNSVMHKQIKFKDCSSIKDPTTIPPNGTLVDIIIPCYGVKFNSNQYLLRWEAKMLPSPSKVQNPEFGVFIPIFVGDKSQNYQFKFIGQSVEKKW